jgi:predicted short-subunit dehydrogenase-like oxidoreductase (DUF2520 family)
MAIESRPGFFLLGGGRTGASLAWYFLQKNIHITALVEKNPERFQYLQDTFHWNFLQGRLSSKLVSESALIILAIQDRFIADSCYHLSRLSVSWKDKMVIHCSGTLSTSILQPLSDQGALTASFHPIYSFPANPAENRYLKDCWFDIESDDQGYEKLKRLIPVDPKKLIRVDAGSKLKTHLASVFFSNFITALAAIGEEISRDVIKESVQLRDIFHPLIQSALHQYHSAGIPEALTGPASRGDLETILHHLHTLREQDPENFEIYRLLTKKILSLAHLPQDRQNMILDHLKNL